MPNSSPAANASPFLNLLAVLAVGLGASVGPLDFAVNVAFPAISEAFQIQTQTIRWVALFYVLTYGSLVLWFGALGDRIGHLRVFRLGLVLGAAVFAVFAFVQAEKDMPLEIGFFGGV